VRSKAGKAEVSQVESFIRGDMEGFRHVYTMYRQRVLTYCLYFMSDRMLAEDAFQEVFIRVYTHRHQLRDPNALTTWIILITRTVCLNMLRTSRYAPEILSMDDAGTTSNEVQNLPGPSIEQDVLDDELLAALARLPIMYRDAFLLCEMEGYSYEEIARLTKTNSHNVQVRITRAKKLLREMLLPTEVCTNAAPPADPKKHRQHRTKSKTEAYLEHLQVNTK
jgi:RNA polymerase sigma-70 factor (ECF subfamily)